MTTKASDLKKQVLLAVLDCCGRDLDKTFTFETLLVAAWKRDPQSWGLRGFEEKHPDSERLHRELDSRGKGNGGLVDAGLLEKIRPRVYRITPRGLASASELVPSNEALRGKTDRKLEEEIRRILEHPTFRSWLVDANQPKRFRDAGHFWGIAPGTPPHVIDERIQRVEKTLQAALEVLERKGVEQIGDQRRGLLYEREDIERCLQFQAMLKQRFATDLRMLGIAAA